MVVLTTKAGGRMTKDWAVEVVAGLTAKEGLNGGGGLTDNLGGDHIGLGGGCGSTDNQGGIGRW